MDELDAWVAAGRVLKVQMGERMFPLMKALKRIVKVCNIHSEQLERSALVFHEQEKELQRLRTVALQQHRRIEILESGMDDQMDFQQVLLERMGEFDRTLNELKVSNRGGE